VVIHTTMLAGTVYVRAQELIGRLARGGAAGRFAKARGGRPLATIESATVALSWCLTRALRGNAAGRGGAARLWKYAAQPLAFD